MSSLLRKKWCVRMVALFLVISFIVPISTLSYPNKVEAAAGRASSCVAGLAASLGLTSIKWIAGILDVPAQENKTGGLTDTPKTAQQYGKIINDCVLYPLGKAIIISLIRNIGSSVVNWVNSGFQGNPTFITDFEGMLTDTADQAIGTFIEGSDLGFLCNDFGFQIRIALALKYSQPFREQARCTLSGIGENISTNGGRGWDNLLAISTEPQNNVYGAYFIAETELAQRAARALGIKEKRVAIGQGFLDFETCDEYESPADIQARRYGTTNNYRAGTIDVISQPTQTGINTSANLNLGLAQRTSGTQGVKEINPFDAGQYDSALGTQPNVADSLNKAVADNDALLDTKPRCKKSTTKTPGTIIAGKLNSTFAEGDIQRAVAQEIDDVIAATMNQLTQKVIQGAHGLLGLSKKRSSSQSYLSKYQSQLYGASSGSGIPVDTGATSEIQDYQIGSYDEAIALQNSTDPDLNPAGQFLEDSSSEAINATAQQFTASISNVTDTTIEKNLALLKSTSQSSGSNSGSAADGTTQTSQYIQGSMTSSDDANPWWQVDLGEIKKIKEVRVWAVSGKPASQTLETFRVVVGGGAGQWSSDLISGAGASNPIIVPVNQSGSTVRIEKVATPYQCSRFEFDEDCYHPLELAEVQVMEDIVIDLSSANLAPGTTSNSSTTSGTNTATDTRTGTSTLSWTPASPATISVSSSKPLNHELKLGAEKTATNLTVEIGLYKNGVRVPFLNVFNDDFDILRGATNGSKSSSQSAITSSTGGIRFKMSVDSNASYSFVLKGTLRPSASSGGYTFQTKVSDSTDTELSDKSQTTSFSL